MCCVATTEPCALNPLSKIEHAEAAMLRMPQIETKLTHRFAPGVYMREIFMPAQSIVIGHEHKTSHFNVILSGKAVVMMDGHCHQLKAGDVVVSESGVRKVLYVEEDMRWATIHPTTETDVERLEEQLIIKSGSWLDYAHEVAQMQQHAEGKQLCHSSQSV